MQGYPTPEDHKDTLSDIQSEMFHYLAKARMASVNIPRGHLARWHQQLQFMIDRFEDIDATHNA
jgi:hypothetical protein